MQAVLSQAGLELVRHELRGAITCELLWHSEVLEQPRHHVHQASGPAFPFINVKPVAEAEVVTTCVLFPQTWIIHTFQISIAKYTQQWTMIGNPARAYYY